MARFPVGIFLRCRVLNHTASTVQVRTNGGAGEIITAQQSDDCTSSGVVTILSDGNRAIAISGNEGRVTNRQMEEFYHSRPAEEIKPEEAVIDEEEGISVKVFFLVDTGSENYDFYIGGDRVTPSLFLNHVQTLDNITSTQATGFLNNTGLGVAAYRAHAAVLEQSTLAALNAGCCNGAYIDIRTGQETPFAPPPGWVAHVTVRNLEERYIVAYTYNSYSEGQSNTSGYIEYGEGQSANQYGSSYDQGLRIGGNCYCDGIPSGLYPLRLDVTVTANNIQRWTPDGWSGNPNINDSTTAGAIYGAVRITNPAGGFNPPGITRRLMVQRLSYTGEEEATRNPDPLVYVAETYDPEAVDAYFQSLASDNSDSQEVEGIQMAPIGKNCGDVNMESTYQTIDGYPEILEQLAIQDACIYKNTNSFSQFTGFRRIAKIRLRDFFAGASCGNEWMGEIINACGDVLEDTYSYCVQLSNFPNDPMAIPTRKPTPPDGHPFFDGWVGIEGTTEFDMEVPGPGYGPVAVEDVSFSYCSGDPSAYRLLYKWSNPDEDPIDPGVRGQDQLTGEGLPDDDANVIAADQNWIDWRVKFEGDNTQQGRVNNTVAYTGTTPNPLVLPSVPVANAQWVANNPTRTKAIARVGSEWRLYTGGSFVPLVANSEVTTLLTSNPKGINWTSPNSTDVLYVTEWNELAYTQPTELKIIKLSLTDNILTKQTELQGATQPIGFPGAEILSISAIEV